MIKFIFLMVLSSPLFAAGVDLSWVLPELRQDGSQIESIDRLNIYQTSDDGSQVVYEVDSTSTSFQILDLAEGSYSFQISTVELGQEGDKSPPIAVPILPPIEIIISKAAYPALTVRVKE